MKWFKIEIYYDDEIQAENEDEAHTQIVGALQMGALDLIIEIDEITD